MKELSLISYSLFVSSKMYYNRRKEDPRVVTGVEGEHIPMKVNTESQYLGYPDENESE